MQEINNYIEFKKERDLGAIITDTFKFIRDNWKDYFLTILKIVGPVLILGLVALIGYFYAISDLFQSTSDNNVNPASFLTGFLPWMLIMLFVFVALYTLLSMTSLYFIKSYIEHKGKADFEEVKNNVLQNFWQFLGLGFIITLSVIIGYMFCIAPGIWLAIVLSLAIPIMIFEQRNVGDSYSHAFTLIKEQWWNTFGVILVVNLLVGVLGQAFSIPTLIYQFTKMATSSNQDPSQIFDLFKDPIYIALNLAGYAFKFILYSIPLIASVFIYYDLNEQKNLTGTLEKIEKIGE